jgi:hypothetical protein
VQDVFNLGKLLLDKGFQLPAETRLRVGEALQKFGKNAFSVGDIGERILAANGFSIIATRWLVIFAGADRTVATCPWHYSPEYRQPAENVLHLPLMYRRTSTRAWLLPLDFLSKKARTVQVRAFLCFLYASARTVTCGNGDGDNGGHHADAFHGCCVLCNFYLSVSCAYIG